MALPDDFGVLRHRVALGAGIDHESTLSLAERRRRRYDPGVSQPAPRHSYTFREYLTLEDASNVKHEFFNGEIYGMAGGTPEHAALAASIASALLVSLRGGPCRVYTADLRIRVLETGLATYPDVTVVCGDPQRDPQSDTTVTNPKLLVEVLSNSTAAYDRGEKLQHYKSIPSLQAVMLVSRTSRRIEVHERADTGFRNTVYAEEDRIKLACVGLDLSLSSVYEDAGL
ncbi:MAG: Uma2 family endonuclease [Proteobacteria bacterium]|nr:Uma2 family endonuclease [Pseudomonadota bacterium]